MKDFVYHVPTRVIFGKNTQDQVGNLVKEFGGNKVLILSGSQSTAKSGLLAQVEKSLRDCSIAYCRKSGVMPNPRLSFVRQVLALIEEEKVDFILALGGGSVIDCAKAVAIGACYQGDVWDLFARKAVPQNILSLGVVLTLPAAGSETSKFSVITNDESSEGWLKRGLYYEKASPLFAILNPELTYTLPPYQTACGAVDIMMHTMERYFSPQTDTDLTDYLAEGVLKAVIKNAPVALLCPDDYQARSEIMWAGSVSHNDLTGLGRNADFATHQLEHELSGLYDVAHGAGLSALWGSWARYVMGSHIWRFVQFAVNIWHLEADYLNPQKTALQGIEKTEEFFSSLGMPITIKELMQQYNLPLPTQKELEEMTQKCTFFGKRSIGTFQVLNSDDILRIYQLALSR